MKKIISKFSIQNLFSLGTLVGLSLAVLFISFLSRLGGGTLTLPQANADVGNPDNQPVVVNNPTVCNESCDSCCTC